MRIKVLGAKYDLKEILPLWVCMSLYQLSIAVAGEYYLPNEGAVSPGFFRVYSYNFFDYIVIIVFSILPTLLTPKKINSPSDWYALFMVFFVLCPVLSLSLGVKDISAGEVLGIAFTVATSVILLKLVGRDDGVSINDAKRLKVGEAIKKFSLYSWLIMAVAIIFEYSSVMRFAGFEEIYVQRELTSNARQFWGYVTLFFAYVLSTLLCAIGLNEKKTLYTCLGFVGYVIMYMITAEKSMLAFPFFHLLIAFLVDNGDKFLGLIKKFLLLAVVINLIPVFFSEASELAGRLGFMFYTRMVATPGQLIYDYYQFFSENGFTYFSHIRLFDLLIDPPELYASHPKWPQLGWIMGIDMHSVESNSNASFIAIDGMASFGLIGVVVVTALLCGYLYLINANKYKFAPVFWSVIFAQQAFILINGSFFSSLLSFGSGFFLLIFTLSGRVAK